MQVAIKILFVTLLCLMNFGCGSMCQSTYDCDFHAFGGMRDRQDRVNGRVGSILEPAAALPGQVPEEVPLPPEERLNSDDEVGSGVDSSDSEDGSLNESEFRNRLLDELDKLEELPSDVGDSPAKDADSAGDIEVI